GGRGGAGRGDGGILHRSGIIYADVAGLKARGSQSGRLRLPGPGAGRASASQRRYISCDLSVSTNTSPYRSSAPALVTRTFWCQQCWPETGSGWTGNVRFWLTPASSHQIRLESGSALANGLTPWTWRMRH